MTLPAAYDAGLILISRTEHRGYVIAALSGDLGPASAPALREQLLNLLRPAASRLIIDLSVPSMAVAGVLAATGMDQHLDIFPTVKAALAGRRALTGLAEVATGVGGRPAAHLLGRIRPLAATS